MKRPPSFAIIAGAIVVAASLVLVPLSRWLAVTLPPPPGTR